MVRWLDSLALALAIGGVLLVASCSDDCEDEMSDTRKRHGAPEEVNTYNSGDYHNVDWWYWSKGIEFSFTWGKNVDGCEVSTYTFTPITDVVTDSIRTVIDRNKVLTRVDLYPACGISY
jgi:hypothetical protein